MEGELSFGEWLRRRRGGSGLTQTKFAGSWGCAPISLRKIEAEDRRPSTELALRIAEVLCVPKNLRDTFVRYARGEVLAGSYVNGSHHHDGIKIETRQSRLPQAPYEVLGRDEPLARASAELLAAKRACSRSSGRRAWASHVWLLRSRTGCIRHLHMERRLSSLRPLSMPALCLRRSPKHWTAPPAHRQKMPCAPICANGGCC